MNKKIFGLIAALLIIAGCSNNTLAETTTTPTTTTTTVSESTTEATTTTKFTNVAESTTAAESTTLAETSTASEVSTSTIAETTTTTTLSESKPIGSHKTFTGTAKGFTLTCSGWEFLKDDLGKNIVLLSLEFRNDTDKETSYTLNVDDTIMQDGIECTGLAYTSKENSDKQLAKVMPGYSLSFKKAFCIDDPQKLVFVKFETYFSNELFFAFTIDPKTGEASETTISASSSGTSSASAELSVSLKSYKIVKDYQKRDVLLVIYSFSHNKKDASAFAYTVRDEAYQNGIECDSLVISSEIDSSTKLNKILPGVEYEVQAGYLLSDTTSDVTIKVDNLYNFKNDPPLFETTIKLS